MPFNINEFVTNIGNLNGIAPASRFEILLYPRNPFLRDILDTNQQLRFLAYSVDLPGINFSTDYTFMHGYGRVNEIPIRPQTNDCEISLYMDEKSVAYKFFYHWKNLVIFTDGNYYKTEFFDKIQYSTNYYCDLDINFYGFNNKIFTVTLLDCFPTELSGINLDWNNNSATSFNTKLLFRAMKNNLLTGE